MGQGSEDEIEPGTDPIDGIDGNELWQRIGRELRKDLAQLLAGATLCGEQHDLNVRMAQQKSNEFGAGVAARAEHGDLRLDTVFLRGVSHGQTPVAAHDRMRGNAAKAFECAADPHPAARE